MNNDHNSAVNSFTLPQTVYRQALWAVKDLERMKSKLKNLEDRSAYISAINPATAICASSGMIVSDKTGMYAVSIANLSSRISAIEDAFKAIPQKYRQGIRNKLINDIPYDSTFGVNTWKKWQQIFIYHVAINLELY